MSDTIIQRIQKLLNLSTSENEHESAQALKMAMRLMQEHQISESMIATARGQNEPVEEIENHSDPLFNNPGKNRSQWRSFLGTVLSQANSCEIWGSEGDLHIVGRASDVTTVRYLFQYCVNEIDRLASRFAGKGKSFTNNYRIGVVSGIKAKLAEGKQEARNAAIIEHGSAATNAIVKIDNKAKQTTVWFERFKANNGLRPKGYGASQVRHDARALGHSDGKTINLGSGSALGSGATKRLPGGN